MTNKRRLTTIQSVIMMCLSRMPSRRAAGQSPLRVWSRQSAITPLWHATVTNDESLQVMICNWGFSEATINCHCTLAGKVGELFDNSHKPNEDLNKIVHVWRNLETGHTGDTSDSVHLTCKGRAVRVLCTILRGSIQKVLDLVHTVGV